MNYVSKYSKQNAMEKMMIPKTELESASCTDRNNGWSVYVMKVHTL
jgi:hypothetical protein